MSTFYRHDHLFIGGRRVAPISDETVEVISPSTEEPVGRVPCAGRDDVDAAVAAARAAFRDPDGWRTWPAGERAAALDRLAGLLDERIDELTTLLAWETGRPVGGRRASTLRGSELLRYYAEVIRTLVTEERRAAPEATSPIRHSIVRREPIGVTAAITPYNGSLTLPMYKLAPALAAGGTAVFKPPPQAPLESYLLAEAVAASGIPDGVLNIVPGDARTGEWLVTHPGIDKIGFTGSTAAGRRIAELAGRALKPVTLELGGKSAAVLLEDADLSAFVGSLGVLGFLFSGQNCFIHSRILAPRRRYAEVVEAVTAFAAGLAVGDPFDPATRVGPLITAEHRDRVASYVRSGLDEGARLTTGGGAPDRPGWYFEPTVFADATNDMRICQEEIFGPVLAVIPYDTEEEALTLAGDSDFGLAGSVWTADEERGVALASRMDSGSVGVNGFGFNTAAPFAGRRGSGLGVELGVEALASYLRFQAVHLL
ncbi:aldehyde dehydrogenase [Streptosporangium sp. NPDC002544]|uniref:aldehyde dehydrogenase n=1 Tax=unclassified Streptosporangium TaxID=2632669 RepID=UPI00332AF3D7